MSDIDEIVSEFLVESHENLDQLDRDLVSLEQQPDSRELVASVFRTIHTIKGTSGFLAFNHLESITHAGESLLARIRDGKLPLDEARTSVLLDMVDAVRSLLAHIELAGDEGSPDHSALVARLEAAHNPTALTTSAPAEAPESAPESPPGPASAPDELEPETEPEPPPVAEIQAPTHSETKLVAEGDPQVETEPVDALSAHAVHDSTVVPRIGEILIDQGLVDDTDVALALLQQDVQRETSAAQAESGSDHKRSVADSTLRVDVDLLDSLMRLVGELVLTRNQVVAHAATLGDTTLQRSSQRLNLIASELQEGVMKTRMQPIDNVWSKLPRVVRDLSVSCGRQVRLVMDGRDTELDKTILEAIKDPLTHLVRNSIDHGIEPPNVRIAAGKPAEGVLSLRAYHEGGQVNIEVADDGAGIDAAKIGQKALAKGLVTRESLSTMSPRDVLALIFEPGLSTREQVSNVSGRGVGMDVVKTNIENIGGAVDVASEPGAGTTIRIKIPLTLAIIPTVTIESGGQRFAVPQISLVELVSLDGDHQQIEHISGSPVYRLRGKLLPLVFLDELLRLRTEERDPAIPAYIAVLNADGQQFGIVVDQVLNTEEIVVKPLSQQLKRLSMYSGATILGDGRVALILDVLALAQQSSVLAPERRHDDAADLNVASGMGDTESYLVVRLGTDRRVGIPLATVTRLEEFKRDVVEHAGRRDVVQYRGAILPLVQLGEIFGVYAEENPETIQVIVYSAYGRSVGIVVEEILDITESSVLVRGDTDDSGLAQSAVLQDRITELLDVRAAMAVVDPHFSELAAQELASRRGTATDDVMVEQPVLQGV